MTRALDLFSGTGSFGNHALIRGYDVVSVDWMFPSTHRCDILRWDYKRYPPKTFDVIWASPPCTEFSRAKTTGTRNLKYAMKIVNRTLKIIKYFKPKWYVIENPVGLLRHSDVMKNRKDLKTVSYCKYGFKYKKDTDLWTNVPFVAHRCVGTGVCPFFKKHGFHEQTVQKGNRTSFAQKPTPDVRARYSVPKALVKSIFDAISRSERLSLAARE